MRISNVDFLSIVSEDNASDDECNVSTSSSLLSSVSQSSSYSSAISRFCGFASSGMKKMPLLGNAVLFSAIFSHLFKNANAEVPYELRWNDFKSGVCYMFFLNSVIDYINDQPELIKQGYIPRFDVRSELMSLGKGYDSVKSLVFHVNNDHEYTALNTVIDLSNKPLEMMRKLLGKLSLLGVDIESLPFDFSYSPIIDTNYISNYCPNLEEFFENELNPTTTIATTTTTTVVPVVPGNADDDLTASSTESFPVTTIVIISAAALLLFAFVSFLIGAACSRVKKRRAAKSVCGRSSTEGNDRRNNLELVELASSSAQVEAPKQEEEVVMMVSDVDAEEVEDLA